MRNVGSASGFAQGVLRVARWALLLIAPAAAWAPEAFAQAPVILTYQGRLKESGVPVTGNRQVFFNICSAPTGGTCNATATQWVGATNGLFRSTFTLPSGVDLTVGSWWMEVDIVGTGALSPREQWSASPYAIYASSAATLAPPTGAAGVTLTNSLFLTGGANVGIGTTNPGGTLSVQPQASANYSLFVSSQNGAATLVVSSQGYVGVGTTSPGAKLDIAGGGGGGTAMIMDNNTAVSWRDSGGTLRRGAALSGLNTFFFGDLNNTGYDTKLVAGTGQPLEFIVGVTERARVDSAGNVGIGTTSPNARVEVSSGGIIATGASGYIASMGSVTASGFFGSGAGLTGVAPSGSAGGDLTGSYPNPTLALTLAHTWTGAQAVNNANLSVTGSGNLLLTGTGLVGLGTSSPESLLHLSSGALSVFGAQPGSNAPALQVGVSTFVVLNNGNVGIGKASPGALLDVNGTIYANGIIDIFGLGLLQAPGGPLTLNAAAGGDIILQGNSVTAMTVKNAGNVGVGTPNPATKLHMSSGTLLVDGLIAGSAQPALQVGVSSFVVTNGGNVGIGTTNPQAVLNILGPSSQIPLSVGYVGQPNTLQYINGGQFYWDPSGTFVGVNGFNLGNGVTNLSGGGELLNLNAAAGASGNLMDAQVGGVSKMLVTTGGNVGIGTASPATKLHMSSGTLLVDGLIPGFAQPALQVGVSSFVVTNGGGVGLGTALPERSLDIRGWSGTQSPLGTNYPLGVNTLDYQAGTTGSSLLMGFGATSGNLPSQIQAYTNGKTIFGSLSLNPSGGNVGIGTTSPATTLDVNGAMTERNSATFTPIAAPAAPGSAQGAVYFDNTLKMFEVSQSTGWIPLVHGNQYFVGNGTFYVPPGVSQVYVTMCGGGGGGAGGGASFGGCGGGSGACVINYPVSVTPGGTAGVTVGGAAPGGAAGAAGTAGNTSSFAGAQIITVGGGGAGALGSCASGGAGGSATASGGFTGMQGNMNSGATGGTGANSYYGPGGSVGGGGSSAAGGGGGSATTGIGGSGGAGFVLVQW